MTCGLYILLLDRAGLSDKSGLSGPPGTSSAYFPSFVPATLYYAQALSNRGFLCRPHSLCLHLSLSLGPTFCHFHLAHSSMSFKIHFSHHSSSKHAWSLTSVFLPTSIAVIILQHYFLFTCSFPPPSTTPAFMSILNQK